MFLPALLRTGLGDVLECEFLLGKEEDGGYPWLTLPFDLEKLSTPTELLLGTDGVDAGVVASILGPTDGGFDPLLEFRRETLFVALEFVLPCLFGESLTVVGIEDLGRVFEVPLFCTRGERPAEPDVSDEVRKLD